MAPPEADQDRRRVGEECEQMDQCGPQQRNQYQQCRTGYRFRGLHGRHADHADTEYYRSGGPTDENSAPTRQPRPRPADPGTSTVQTPGTASAGSALAALRPSATPLAGNVAASVAPSVSDARRVYAASMVRKSRPFGRCRAWNTVQAVQPRRATGMVVIGTAATVAVSLIIGPLTGAPSRSLPGAKSAGCLFPGPADQG